MEEYNQVQLALARSNELLAQSARLLAQIRRACAEDHRRMERVQAALETTEYFMRSHELLFLSISPFVPYSSPLSPSRVLPLVAVNEERKERTSVP